MQFGAVNSLLPHIKGGKLKALAVAGDKRIGVLPELPTIAEAGVKGDESDIWTSCSAWTGWISAARFDGVFSTLFDRNNRPVAGPAITPP
jgi:hypothetical protein